MRRKIMRSIHINAPAGYWWVGRRCLPESEVFGDYGKLIHNSCSSIKFFRTYRKAHNVLWSLPKGCGFHLYREYWIKGGFVKKRYSFNSLVDVDNYDKEMAMI